MAIRSVNSTTTIDNRGTITGSQISTTETGALESAGTLESAAVLESASPAPTMKLFNGRTGVVNSGSILADASITNLGTLSIGLSGEIRTTTLDGDLVDEAGSLLLLDLDSSTFETDNDFLQIDGTARFALGSRIIMSLLAGFQPKDGEFFDVVSAKDIVFGDDPLLDYFTFPDLAGFAFKPLVIHDAEGEDLRVTVSSVPEPSTLPLLGLAAAGVLYRRRRKRPTSRWF